MSSTSVSNTTSVPNTSSNTNTSNIGSSTTNSDNKVKTTSSQVPNISINTSTTNVGSSIMDSVNEVNNQIFTKSTTSILIAAASLYILFLGIVELSRPDMTMDPAILASNRRIDITVVIIFIAALIYYYMTMTPEQQKYWGSTVLHDFKVYYNDPMALPWFVVHMFTFYLFIYIFGISMKPNEKPFSILVVEVKLFIWLASLLIVDFFIFVLKVPIIDDLYSWMGKWWHSLPSDTTGSEIISGHEILGLRHEHKGVDITPAPYISGSGSGIVLGVGSSVHFDASQCPTAPAPTEKKEVFHVGNNKYTYEEARETCSALNATLATYDQLEEYYNKGGEFCAYGWSEGQMALFPTQQSTIDRLKKKKGHENDCGRKSINGGFFANPYLQFGANCYGVKPLPTDAQLAMMNMQNLTESKQDVDIKNKADFYNKNKVAITQQQNISSFNKNRWSEY